MVGDWQPVISDRNHPPECEIFLDIKTRDSLTAFAYGVIDMDRRLRNHSCSHVVHHRRLACEPLEDRRLLSVGTGVGGIFGSIVNTGQAAAAIIAADQAGQSRANSTVAAAPLTDTAGKSARVVGLVDVAEQIAQTSQTAATTSGPTISSVVVVPPQGLMTWNVQDPATVISSTLAIDGTPVAKISGPFTAASGGVNFSGKFGSLPVGLHNYTITATDISGNSSQLKGTFNVLTVGPTISSVVVVASQGLMTWNVQDPGTVVNSSLSVDGTPVAKISGPFTAASGGVNFSGKFGTLPVGLHNFTITATDISGNSSQFKGTFNVLTAGPTISSVVVVASQGLMTWNVQDSGTVVNSSLSVDGTPVAKISGPFTAASGGVNFSGKFGSLPVGLHNYTITATDNSGKSSQFKGTFKVLTLGPTISSVVVVVSQGLMTWNVQDPGTVVGSTLAIHGTPVAKISGPFTAASGGVNFSGKFGTLAVGLHNFTITATDISGNSSQFKGTFNVA